MGLTVQKMRSDRPLRFILRSHDYAEPTARTPTFFLLCDGDFVVHNIAVFLGEGVGSGILRVNKETIGDCTQVEIEA